MQRHIEPARLTFAQLVKLTNSPKAPAAKLGVEGLRSRVPRDELEIQLLLSLANARCEPLRGEIVRLIRTLLSSTGRLDASWLLAFLDSADRIVRLEGIDWFRSEPRARDDVNVWRCLVESPYDEVRIALVSELEARVRGGGTNDDAALGLNAESLRFLWASVLLDIHRGSRARPKVARQVAGALVRHPDRAGTLMPLLAVAVRSSRGPERRAGLAAVAALLERGDQTDAEVRAVFPELKLL
jgi:hypothetical protein